MVSFAIIAIVFVVMFLMVGISLLKQKKLSRNCVCDAIKHAYARISRYAGIVFILFLLLALSYEQTKELINNFLPSQYIEQIKLYIKLIFRSESVFSAVEAVTIYSLLVSCCSGLGAIFVRCVQTFFEHNAVSFCDRQEISIAANAWEERVPLKSFLVYSKFNS